MSKPFVLTAVVVASLILSRFAAPAERDDPPLARNQSHESVAIQGRSKIPWKEAVGQQVIAQGIAWGKSEKGIGERVILDGTTIYVGQPISFDEDGRLVEVSGKLEKRRVPPAPATSGGFGPTGLEFYAISGAKWRHIDVVSSPWLVVDQSDPAVK